MDLGNLSKMDLVLKMLQDSGSFGVSSKILNMVAFRYSDIIFKLRKKGYLIQTVKEDEPGLYRYILIGKDETQVKECIDNKWLFQRMLLAQYSGPIKSFEILEILDLLNLQLVHKPNTLNKPV